MFIWWNKYFNIHTTCAYYYKNFYEYAFFHTTKRNCFGYFNWAISNAEVSFKVKRSCFQRRIITRFPGKQTPDYKRTDVQPTKNRVPANFRENTSRKPQLARFVEPSLILTRSQYLGARVSASCEHFPFYVARAFRECVLIVRRIPVCPPESF